MTDKSKSSIHRANSERGAEIICKACDYQFAGPEHVAERDTCTCPDCGSTLVLTDIDGEYFTDSASPHMTYRWEILHANYPLPPSPAATVTPAHASAVPAVQAPQETSLARSGAPAAAASCPTCHRSHCSCDIATERGLPMQWKLFRTFALSLHRGIVFANLECLICSGTGEEEIGVTGSTNSAAIDLPSGYMVRCEKCKGEGRRIIPSSGDDSEDFDSTWTAMIDALPKHERKAAFDALVALEDAATVANAVGQ